MALDYINRTAGLDRFLGMAPPKKFAEKTAMEKFADISQESRQPGAIASNDAKAETAFRDSLMGNILGAFIPGVNQYYSGQDKAARKSALAGLLPQLEGMNPREQLTALAGIDPQYTDDLVDYSIQQADPLRKIQLASANMGLEDARRGRQRENALAELYKSAQGDVLPPGAQGPVRPGMAPRDIALARAQIDPMAYGDSALASLAPQKDEIIPVGADSSLYNKSTNQWITPPRGAGVGVPEKTAKLEGDIRKEFEGLNKDFRDVERAYTRVQKSVESPSAAGDLALIFNYMKMLDPGSTVREGEFANAQNSGGVDDVTRAWYNKLVNGERLSTNVRNDFYTRAEMLYGGAVGGYNSTAERYRDIAAQYGLDPERVAKMADVPKAAKQQTLTTPNGISYSVVE